MKKSLLILCLVFATVICTKANNITVANISLSDQVAASHYCNVKFDLSWENSWRTTSVPNNWDAAWVFVKYRVSGGVWHHATLSALAVDHTPATGSTITPSPDGKGVFIYRSANGTGTNTWTNLKLKWLYGTDGVADDASLEVKVFSVEMVYIPQGPFYLGDGNGTTESNRAIHPAASDNMPFLVSTSPGQIKVDINGNDDSYIEGQTGYTLSIDGDGGIVTTGGATPQNNPNYPTGYQAFYLMKYNVTQEQYVDFINSLTRTQQDQRVEGDISGVAPSAVYIMSNQPAMTLRNGVRCPADISAPGPVTLFNDFDTDGIGNETNDGQNITCNYLGWTDVAAYADWSGLRPITELEMEKVQRGPNTPVLNEFAWGTTNIWTVYYTLANSGQATEVITNCGINTGNAAIAPLYSGGPVRAGVFAASAFNKTRQETGAGYYGNMELTGNLWTLLVSSGTVAGRSFTGLHGNGELNAAGDADVDYWPGINGNNTPSNVNTVYAGITGVTGGAGEGIKGGAYGVLQSFGFVSDRSNCSYNVYNRAYPNGIRVGRTAP